MGIEYRWVDWTFFSALWSETIQAAVEKVGKSDLAELLEVNEKTIDNWAMGRWTDAFRWPSMFNFLKVVNLLDLDPRKFFELAE